MNRDRAEAVAIAGLAFIAGDEDLLGRFMGLTGLAPDDLRRSAGEPDFLAGVLDFLLADEAILLRFASENGFRPEEIGPARRAFGGMEGVEW